MPARRDRFDPRAILAALERNYVNYVVIGALAQVLRGADEITSGVDICPSFGSDNLERLMRAAEELDAARVDGNPVALNDETVGREPLIALSTSAGLLQVVASPEGAPRGYVDLRRAATREHLGGGIQPLVASTADLARLSAALHRDRDLQRLPQLRRIIELEVDRERTLAAPAAPARRRAAARPGRRISR
jgi:hypothetical protein